ncbi:Lipase, GDSL [Artemisia annua]|uniref:Lipase, GDSL n=1 Tax=Artemisia annua TaxID=35608 RepID=A0A2U1M3E8_ARTAN|nr:Lipase, GDSL [Artemisia annua]
MANYFLVPQKGFTNGALKACCGGAGPYNINLSAICGDESSTVCDQPDTYVCWDGIHLTEAAYKIIAKNLYHGPYTTPEFKALCPTSTFQLEGGLSSYI